MWSHVCYHYICYLYNVELISLIYISFASEAFIASFLTKPFTRSFYISDLPLHLNHFISLIYTSLPLRFIRWLLWFIGVLYTICVFLFSCFLAMDPDYFHFNILIILMMSKSFNRLLTLFFLFQLLLVLPIIYVSSLHCTVVIFASSAL